MRTLFVSVIALMLSANTVSAQNAPRAFTPLPPNPVNHMNAELARQQEFREDADGRTAQNRREQRERDRVAMERAERLAALVNAGQCREAHRIALAENDPQMAERIATVCRGGE